MREAYKPLYAALLIILIGVSLSSVYLFSALDGKRYAQEHIDLSAETALGEQEGSLPPVFLATLFVPNLFGNLTGDNIRRLNPAHTVLFWEANLSGGMAVSLLLLLAVILSFKLLPIETIDARMRRWYILVFLVIYVLAILCVLGRHTPFYRYIIGSLPGIGQLPRPIRYRMLQCFATAVLAGVGVESLLKLQVSRFKYLRSWVWAYIIVVFFLIAGVLTYPWASQKKYSGWLIKPSALVSGYSPAREPVCMYSSSFSSSKIGAIFDGDSEGEIRYADNLDVLPSAGKLLAVYRVDRRGWQEFKVDLPPRKYVWFYQKNGPGRIGYLKTHEQVHTFNYDSNKNKWLIRPRSKSIWLYQEGPRKPISFIGKLLTNEGLRKPILISIIYWLFVSLMIILCLYYFPLKKFGYLLAGAALLEFLIFGILAFYGNNFTSDVPTISQMRAQRPLSHPIVQDINRVLASTIKDAALRIATNQPFHDNFFRLGGQAALMGYEMHPLESRFKHAIETAYNQPMNYSIYYNEPFPPAQHLPFLNNFSVGYFIYFSQTDMFKSVTELNPANADIYVELGNLYRRQFKFPEAEAVFKQAIKLNPASDQAYINLGRCYEEQSRHKDAENMFRRAAALNSLNSDIDVELGNNLQNQGRYREAEEVLKKSLDLNLASDQAYINLGRCYFIQGRYPEAESMFKQALELNSTNAEMYVELGNFYSKQGKFQESEQMLKLAIELNPKSAQPYFLLGNVYQGQARYAEAEKMFKKALELNPQENSFNAIYGKGTQSIFIDDTVVPLAGATGSFLHINPFALPRIFTLDRIIFASEEEQLKQLVSGDLSRAVYLSLGKDARFRTANEESTVLSFADLQRANAISGFNLDNPNRINVDIEVTIPSMLVLTEVWYPGWEARIDGKPTEIYRVNYCQRGVWLEKGKHHVRFYFQPKAWLAGLVISLGTIILLLGIGLIGFLKKSTKNAQG